MSLDFYNPSVDARLQGAMHGSASADSVTEHSFILEFDCKLNGFEIYAKDSNIGDSLTFETQYNVGTTETPVWYRYKKFGKDWFIAPNVLNKVLLFPTEPKAGVRISVKYSNTHATNDVDFFINLYQFVDVEIVKTSEGQQGTDW